MSKQAFTLSPLAVEIGYTLAEVRQARADAYVLPGGRLVTMPKYCPPALATEAARMALGGPVSFSHLSGGYPVYSLD